MFRDFRDNFYSMSQMMNEIFLSLSLSYIKTKLPLSSSKLFKGNNKHKIYITSKKTMSDAYDENVAKIAKSLEVNDSFTRMLLLKWSIISMYGVARGFDSVTVIADNNEEMILSYPLLRLLRLFGFLSMYIYVFRLACCFLPSYPAHTSFKGRPILLAIMSLIVNVSMFYNCYTWQRWDAFFLTLGVIIATVSLAQLIYGLDGLGPGCILWIAILGSAWGINGLYFDITSRLTICTFFIITIFQMAFTSDMYNDKTKLYETQLLASIKVDFHMLYY